MFETFKRAVAEAAAFRFITFLSSDGAGYKRPDNSVEPSIVAPAIYPKEGKGGIPEPIINVLSDGDFLELRTDLDSVGSQANRFEAALDAYLAADSNLPFPRLEIRLDQETTIRGLLPPHRGADAYFKATQDPNYFAKMFEMRVGQVLFGADCTKLLERFPTSLVFGCWDARDNPRARVTRLLTSRIEGITRISAAGLEGRETSAIKNSIKVFAGAMRQDPEIGGSCTLYPRTDAAGTSYWELTPRNAAEKLDAEKKAKGKGAEKNPYSLASNGLGDIIGPRSLRGVRIDYAMQTTVLSLTALRALHFPLDGVTSTKRDRACHVYLAALALLAYELSAKEGYFLRSRCALVQSDHAPIRQMISSKMDSSDLSWDHEQTDHLQTALTIYKDAVVDLAGVGIEFPRDTTMFQARPGLTELIKKTTKNHHAAEAANGEGE